MKYSLFSNMKYINKESCQVVKPMKKWLVVNFISSLMVPLLGTLIASAVVYIITNGYDIASYLSILLLLVGLTILFESLKIWSFTRYTWESTFIRCNQFWLKLSRRTISCDYERFEPRSRQRTVEKAFEALDSNWVGIEGMMKQIPVFYINIVGMLVYAFLVSIYIPWILVILIAMSVVNFFLTRRANLYLEAKLDDINKTYYERHYLSKDVTDPVNGKDIRIYKMQNWFNKLFLSLTKKRMNIENKINAKNLLAKVSDSIFLMIRDGLAYFTLVLMVLDNQLDVATFTFMIGIVTGFSTWLNGFVDSFNQLRKDSIVVNHYRNYLNEQDHFNHGKGIDIKTLTYPLAIEFKNVSFVYPDTDQVIIRNVNLKVNPGEKIAIVGNNGAGKTTLIKLLCGLYEPTSGEILINGINLKEFNLEEYISLLSVVFQDSNPLAFTILENVICAPISMAQMDRFWQAVGDAGLKEKIEKLERKELTYLTQEFDDSGIRLSGGEVQKLMLARALYKNAPLLILDEPTASLDPINEEKMYLTYESFSRGNTSLFISHRLSSTKFCDRIIFLEHGEIIETGTHDELMGLNGKYKEMFDIQSQYYKKDGEENEE